MSIIYQFEKIHQPNEEWFEKEKDQIVNKLHIRDKK
jgi:hypothetical protein